MPTASASTVGHTPSLESRFRPSSRREGLIARRRLLRAINELKFDHEMGKLSSADYDQVRKGFELRAIEVMRQLDAGQRLHPELEKRLGSAFATGPGLATPAPSEISTDRVEVPRTPPTASVVKSEPKSDTSSAEVPAAAKSGTIAASGDDA